ncbi:hypothetical protein [Mucilaginibacter glaciei]|uniref:Lipoprotein n=1 Tax=Mucilaginibacter glaciei TaxID=2772109 RepID=A0A926NSC7_9SPHI|nr:hypothetical protein [Mucilaginibacter glaciei]MBD1394127.1 hypothetical protein [Mucilaginibacter glaciei]
MKIFKYLIALLVITNLIGACKGRENATLGGTSDTSAKAGTGKPAETMSSDSAKKDTTYKGNADPTGRDVKNN